MNKKKYPVLDPVATGRRIKELRKAKNLRVEDISDYLGLESLQAVYKWQRGDSLPTLDNIYALSRLFETSVDDILREREEDDRSSSFHVIFLYFICNYSFYFKKCNDIYIQ